MLGGQAPGPPRWGSAASGLGRLRELADEALDIAKQVGDSIVMADALVLRAVSAERLDEELCLGARADYEPIRHERRDRQARLLGVFGVACI